MELQTMMLEYSASMFWMGALFGSVSGILLMLAIGHEKEEIESPLPVAYPMYNQATDPDSFLFRKKRR